jgi:hypothetical protein
MQKIILAVTLLIFSLNAFSQPAIQWQKCLGGTKREIGKFIQQTSDGGYVVAGASMSNDGDVTGHHGVDSTYDYWVVKLNGNGMIQWQKSLGGTSDDQANSVQQTTDGGYIIAGYTYSNDGDVSGNHGFYDCWLVKLDVGGNIQWQKSLGGTDMDMAYSVCQTNDGGYIVGGSTNSNNGDVSGNHGDYDYWLIKLNGAGTILWQKCLGGTGSDGANAIQQTADDGYVIAGHSISNNGDVTGNHGAVDYWIVKLDTGGVLQWQKCLGGTSNETAYSVQQTSNGGYIVTGFTTSNDSDVAGFHGGSDYWIIRLDSLGSLQWQKCLGGSLLETAYSISQTIDGGYIIAGSALSNDGDVTGVHGSNQDCWLVKLDTIGNLQWQKCLGGTIIERAYCVQQAMDGGFIFTGEAYSSNGDVTANHSVYNDYWVVKLAPYVGIEENDLYSEINIYPNPVTNEFRIQNSELKIEKIEIYDVVGQQVFLQSQTSNLKPLTINVSSLPSGIYFVKVADAEGNSGTQKFVKM